MLLGFVLLFAYGFIVWLVFFKFRWLKFTIPWGFFSTFFVLHLGIIFLIGLRFVAPTSTEARIVQRTIQLTPRLSEPTLVTAVRIATIQYKAGRRDLLWVAQLQTAQLATELNVIKLRGAQRANRVRLYQALGGSFDAAPPPTVSAR